MLLILADVYRIATLRAPEPPVRGESADRRDTARRRSWFGITGLRL